MASYVLNLNQIEGTHISLVGGKGASLGELSKIVTVPAGFCVTTQAFDRVVEQAAGLGGLLEKAQTCDPADRKTVADVSRRIREVIENIAIPDDIAAAVIAELTGRDAKTGYAVRSSATAEDLPTASFAGQQDSYLNVVGQDEVLRHVSRCWASLFTDRAVTYRLRNGFDHRQVAMAVVVQTMVPALASGVVFTADPVTSNRKVATVEATFGLGEALVSGHVSPDTYRLRDGEIVEHTLGTKHMATHASPGGGIQQEATGAQSRQPALTTEQVLRLERLARTVEARYGCPQDIEWCLADDKFHIVQSRPITTLFPVPEQHDDDNHVYLSVGHQQMMTDAMKPLGLSVWQLTTPRRMDIAGGRLFVDVTPLMSAPESRANFLKVIGESDPLMADALASVVGRDGFIPLDQSRKTGWTAPETGASQAIETDETIVPELIAESRADLDAARREIDTKSGTDIFDFIETDMRRLQQHTFEPTKLRYTLAGIEASQWLNEHVQDWLGDVNAADVLTQSVPHNVTSQMGLALLDVADAIRPYPDVVAFLREVTDDNFVNKLADIHGGGPARAAIDEYLASYGMRCVGEIDITRPRWSERPAALVPMLLSNIDNFEPGAGQRHFEQGLREALRTEHELLERLAALPDGQAKADETKHMIDVVRTFIGYREYPKYAIICRYFMYKQALLREAQSLVDAAVLDEREDVFFLSLREFREVVVTEQVDRDLLAQRKADFAHCETLTPPRVLTSEGEAVRGAYRRDDLPEDALAGLAVSAGTIEGRARVIVDMAQADPLPGDILVTAHTDPSWSPLFVAVSGLVTEVGGMMTHGAVIAREYGLPAVVGVHDATELIKDGQRIRVNGTDGYIEILSDPV